MRDLRCEGGRGGLATGSLGRSLLSTRRRRRRRRPREEEEGKKEVTHPSISPLPVF